MSALKIMASLKGTIYHFVVLGDVASSDPAPTLFAYESVELESGLLTSDDEDDRFDCPIVLMSDPVVPGLRYLCHHR